MSDLDRLKILIRHLIVLGEIPNQRELGKLMGYKNESSFSQILNGKQQMPKVFLNKLKSVIPSVNTNWIETGEGEMLVNNGCSQVVQQNQTGDNINGTHVEVKSDSGKLLDVILQQSAQLTKSQEQLSKSQEQIDRLISIIERK